jgi:hypothetical protein
LSLLSIALVSLSIAVSASSRGRVLAEPVVVDDRAAAGNPDELAVPALLVPRGGGVAIFAELPAALESMPELLKPPALDGPDGTPLTAPADPALGEPAVLPLAADGPLAAPPALCPNELTGNSKRTDTASAADALVIANSLRSFPSGFNGDRCCGFRSPFASL